MYFLQISSKYLSRDQITIAAEVKIGENKTGEAEKIVIRKIKEEKNQVITRSETKIVVINKYW